MKKLELGRMVGWLIGRKNVRVGFRVNLFFICKIGFERVMELF